MKISIVPEHIIISCEIERNGYRGVTLRIAPLKRGGVFRFYTVVGGFQAHPELDYRGWLIEGDTFTKNREEFIQITSKRKLTKDEKAKWERGCLELWSRKEYFTDKP